MIRVAPPKTSYMFYHVLAFSIFQYLSTAIGMLESIGHAAPFIQGWHASWKWTLIPGPFIFDLLVSKPAIPENIAILGHVSWNSLSTDERDAVLMYSYVLLCDGHLTSPSWDENPHVSHVLLVWTCLHFETIHRMRTSALLMVTWYRTSTTSGRHRRRDSCYGAGWKDNMPCNGHSSDPGQCSVTDEVWSLMQVDSHCSYPPDGSCWGSR